MKHLTQVEENRARAEEILFNEMGDKLDANKEQEEDDDLLEGVHEHPQLLVLDPTELQENLKLDNSDHNLFMKTDLLDDEEMSAKIRNLDIDQRMVVDIGVNYAKKFVQSVNRQQKRPTAPLVIVHGGAGTGKSTVIDVLSQSMEKIFRSPGDNPNHPYLIRAAFTGNAASIIKGQTLHTTFNLPFGNEILSLNDKIRDHRRTLLQNLRVLIIDEISLVKSDILYQIHFRLMKDIFQNEMPLGGVAVFVLGDILQIKPTKGNFVYAPPYDKRLKVYHALEQLWKQFVVINLKTNHRQGDDRIYADLLNRVRVGQQTHEDIETLKTRVFSRDDKAIPKDALYISGTNEAVNKMNNMRLCQVEGKEVELKAKVFTETRGEFKPSLDKKLDIRGTTLQYKLCLKKGCRVMLTTNLDVCDGLTNGKGK